MVDVDALARALFWNRVGTLCQCPWEVFALWECWDIDRKEALDDAVFLEPVVERLLAEQREADARVAWKVADDIAHEARAESLDHRWFQDGREAGAREVLASIRGAQ